MAVIGLWVGHKSIETTHAYIEADVKTKEQALDKIAPAGKKFRRFHTDDKLLAILLSLLIMPSEAGVRPSSFLGENGENELENRIFGRRVPECDTNLDSVV